MESSSDRQVHITITTSTVIKTVVVLALFWFLYIVRDLFVIILTAVVIASAIEPFIVWLGKRGFARTLAVILVYLLLILVFASLFYFFVPSLLGDLSDFLTKLPNYLDSVTIWNPFKGDLAATSPVVQNLGLTQSFSFSDLISGFNGAFLSTSQGFFQTISNLFGGLLSLILIIVLSFYLAVQEDGIGKLLRIILPVRFEEYVISLWHRSQAKIGRWLQGQLLLGLIIGVLVYLGLTILGIRNALLLAVLAMVFEIIPVFGPILSAIPSTLIALADAGLTKGLLVVGFYLIIHQFENHLIYPLVVKKIIGIPPILVILALIAGFQVAGVLGILISVPMAAVLVEWLDDVHRNKIARAEKAAAH